MDDLRRHPDVFSAAEAAVYLHLAPDLASAKRSLSTIENLRASGQLAGFRIGKPYFYHRQALDALVINLFAGSFGGAIATGSVSAVVKGPRLKPR